MKKILTSIAAVAFIMAGSAAMAAPQPAQTLNEALSTYIAGDDMRVTGQAVSPFTMSYGGWITPTRSTSASDQASSASPT
jgi:spermidine/putrescine-binding protein